MRKPAWMAWLEFLPVLMIAPFVLFMPYRAGRLIGGLAAPVLYVVLPGYRRIARVNLRLALGDTLSGAEAATVIRRCWSHAVRTFFEFIRLIRMDRDQVFRLTLPPEGYEDYLAALGEGRGVIVASCHLGNWYWPLVVAASLGHAVSVIVRPLDNPLLDRVMNHIFARWGVVVIPRATAPRASLAALRRGETLGLMVDLNAHGDECFVPFFGVPAATPRGLARLRRGTGAAVVVLDSVRRGDRHRIRMRWLRDLPEADEGVLLAIHRHFEPIIREHRECYFWIQPRWKKRPAGEPPLYPGLGA